MMMKMKAQARQFSSSATSSVGTIDGADGVRGEGGIEGEGEGGGGGGGGGRKIYDRIVSKLNMLKPLELVVEDESHKHAGHAGMNGSDAVESHFNVRIIADCFEGLGLVQRHKMIYTLDAEMKKHPRFEYLLENTRRGAWRVDSRDYVRAMNGIK